MASLKKRRRVSYAGVDINMITKTNITMLGSKMISKKKNGQII